MTKLLPAALLAAAAWVGATPLGAARADTIKPAILFDMGGKFDKGFNEGVYNGGQSFTKATGIKIQEFEVQNEGQREQGLRNFAKRGDNPILAIGFAQADGLTVVAKEFPKTHFGIIDAVVDLPNVRSFTFKEHEGSYLVGMLAAMASPGAKVGFVGGMDIPLIRKFECGYKQGAKAVDPNIEILSNMTGSTPAAWNDPVRGGELAKSQMERGATVVYAAAGATSLGVYQAVADAGKLAIGVDSDDRLPSSRPHADLDGQARGCRHRGSVDRRQGRQVHRRPFRARPEGKRRGRGFRQGERQPDQAGMEGQDRAGQAGHHLGQGPGPRLHGRQRLSVLIR